MITEGDDPKELTMFQEDIQRQKGTVVAVGAMTGQITWLEPSIAGITQIPLDCSVGFQ